MRPANLLVQKYGGSSVGTPEKIKKVAARIAKAHQEGSKVVVVVSALGDTTDELIGLAEKVTPQVHEREMDMLLSVGERISMALLSMALRDLGKEAISFTGSQAGIITDESHTRARILELKPTRVDEAIRQGRIAIVAGFQGVSRQKEITTLGRGGSDTTAVALAAALKADRCEVFTDVPGVFSADPRMVAGARRYSELPLDLVFEMAVKGAQVMHARSIEIAREKKFPIYVGLAHPTPAQSKLPISEVGTMLIPGASSLELPKIVSLVCRSGLVQLRFPQSMATQAMAELSEQSILLHEMFVDERGELRILLDPTESSGFLNKFGSYTLPSGSPTATSLMTVSAIGFQLQQNAVVPQVFLKTLQKQGVKLEGLTSHPQSFTVCFAEPADKDKAKLLLESLHQQLIQEE